MQSGKALLTLDPRTKLLLLLGVNVFVFTNSHRLAEAALVTGLVVLLLLCGVYRAACKSAVLYGTLWAVQLYLLPRCPGFLVSSLTIVVITCRKLLPCVTLSTLLVQTTPIRLIMHALQLWHVPRSVIIPLAITIRYFPTLQEEQRAIRDAMKLRDIHGLFRKAAYLAVPLMLSASTTADELSQALTARGIDNPRPKTCVQTLRFRLPDILLLLLTAALVVFAPMFH